MLYQHRALTYEMTKRGMTSEYAGQVLGIVWAVLHPLFWTLLYVFVFTFIFRVRSDALGAGMPDYTTYILVGMIPWFGFQQAMIVSCTSLTSEAPLVKQVIFPIEVLPVTVVLLSFLAQFVSTGALLIYVLFTQGVPPGSYLLLPVLFAVQFLAMAGVAFAFSVIGVFFRDIKDLVRVFCIAGVFFIPVLYSAEMVPESLRFLLYINPFTHLVLCYQDALYYGQFLHPYSWVVFVTGSVFCFVLGYRLFCRCKPFLGNVL
jgi:lipopolysaccharide transport system permease protein